jgi:hypothetical protein
VPYCLLWIYHYIWAYVLPLRTYIQLYWEYVVAILFIMIIPVYWAYIVPYCLIWKYQYIRHTLCRCVLIYSYIGHTLCHIVYYDYNSILGIRCGILFIMNLPVYLGIRCAMFFLRVYRAYVVPFFYLHTNILGGCCAIWFFISYIYI